MVAKDIGGGGGKEYSKLTTVLKAGTGAPDVAMIEYQELPQFVNSGGLLDISQYDGYLKKYFLPWTWDQVTFGGKLYAVPQDIAPMGLIYNTPELKSYHLSVPKTWAQFASEANTYHKKSGKYFTFFPYNDFSWITGMLWQSGVNMFTGSGNNWTINMDSPKAQQVMNYWGNLIKEQAILPDEDWTPSWQHSLAKGQFATVLGASWSPDYMVEPYVPKGQKGWQVTTLPQWNANGPIEDANFGGSTNVITTQSKNPQAAAIFAAWYTTSQIGIENSLRPASLSGGGYIPAAENASKANDFKTGDPFLGGQASFPIFEQGAVHVNTSFQWSPWTAFISNEMTVEFAKAAQGKESWDAALSKIQTDTVQFARSEGYNVTQS